MRTALSVAAIIMSILVLLLSIAGIGGVWALQQVGSRTAVNLLIRVDEAASAVRGDIERIDGRVSTARESVNSIETAANQISQNVAQEGLAATLLPPEKVDQAQARVQDVTDTFNSYRDSMIAMLDMMRVIGSTPLIDLPTPDPERVQKAGEAVDRMQAGVSELQSGVADVRAGAGGQISRVADAAASLDSRLAETQTTLDQVSTRMSEVQASSARLQESIPRTLTVIAAVSTVLLLWVAYTQVVVMRQEWMRFRSRREDRT
ncbi:MAG TPA: hypothetical protein VHS28_05465 [Chloroflexota bacterium]|nr:hypothetical protein [Chloroflexota bacterium]